MTPSADEKDQQIFDLIRAEPGWWAVLSYQRHIAQIARVSRPLTVDDVLNGNVLTQFPYLVEYRQSR